MERFRKSASSSLKRFSSIGSGAVRRFLIPSNPDARSTANVRYGLVDGSGQRISIRVALSSIPLETFGTRIRADLLIRAHEIYTGASYPGVNRLYELTVGAKIQAISLAYTNCPARN